MHINVIVQTEEIEEQKKKELGKKKFLIFIIENGEMLMKKMLLKILNL